MTIIVEDGTAKSDAESYATVAQADSYWLLRENTGTWGDQDLDVKEAALRKATDFITQQYRSAWKGKRYTATQSLCWPRYDVWDYDVYVPTLIASTVVPSEVRNACIELAYRAVTEDLTPDVERQPIQETIGSLQVTYDRSASPYKSFREVDAMLSRWTTGSSVMMRIDR